MTTVNAWPFAIGRGRHVGYRVLVAPRFLADRGAAGQLGRALSGSPERAEVSEIVLSDGTWLQAGFESWAIRSEDVSPGAIEQGPLRDEHGRPLEILVGFVTEDGEIDAIADADMARCRREVVGPLSEFFADEEGWELRVSDPFAAVSTIVPRRRSRGRPTAPTSGVSAWPEQGVGRRRRPVGPIVAVIGLVAIVGGGLVGVLNGDESLAIEPERCRFETGQAAVCGVTVTLEEDEPASITSAIDPPDPALIVEPVGDCVSVDPETRCQLAVRFDGTAPQDPELVLRVTTASGLDRDIPITVTRPDGAADG